MRSNKKKMLFVEAFTQIGSETFHNGAASARFAGYKPSNAHDTAHNLLSQPEIAELIRSKDEANWDWTLERWTQEVAKSAKEVDAKHSNRPRYLELVAKSKGFIKDNSVVLNHLSISGNDVAKLRNSLRAKGLQLDSQEAQPTTYSMIDDNSNTTGCIDGGVGQKVEEPPATPLDMHSTPPQNAQENKVSEDTV